MSRLGKNPVSVPNGVKTFIESGVVRVEGAKGKLSLSLPKGVAVNLDQGKVVVTRANNTAESKANHGLIRTLIYNMVKGVSDGYERRLEIVGVGYRAAVKGKVLNLTLGFSHPVDFDLPEGVTAKVENNTTVVLNSADKALVGETAAKIRGIKPPEPYQGKGVKYAGEHIRRKAGKAAATGK